MEPARAGQARISNPILKGFNPDPSGPVITCRDRLDCTGTFVGLYCNDLTGRRMHSDFDYFTLENES